LFELDGLDGDTSLIDIIGALQDLDSDACEDLIPLWNEVPDDPAVVHTPITTANASSIGAITASMRSVSVKPGVIFLGDEHSNWSDDEVDLMAAGAISNDVGIHRSHDEDEKSDVPRNNDELFDEIMLKWMSSAQSRLFDEMSDFVTKQKDHLEAHKHGIETRLIHQRAQMRRAMASARRKSGSTDRGTTVTVVTDDGTNSQSSTLSVARTTVPSQPHKVQSSMLSVDFAGVVNRASLHDKAFRLHKAYEDAAAKIKVGVAENRLDRMTRYVTARGSTWHDYFLQSSICGFQRTAATLDSYNFKIGVASIICLNAIFIGITSDLSMQRSLQAYDQQSHGVYADIPRPEWAIVVDLLFNITFLAELILRMVCLEGRFCVGPDWRWNFFDVVIVMLSFGEIALESVGFNPGFMRLLRVVRVVRSIRMLRIMRFTGLIRKLRVMTMAIVNCSMMLMWAVLILMIFIFLFSVVFLSAAAQYVSDAMSDDSYVEDMRVFFGSLLMTMITLFMAVAGGVDWWEVLRLLLQISPIYALMFIFFVIITVLAVLNVINAIFVNDAMESTRKDPDMRMQDELYETKFVMEKLQAIFWAIQKDGNNDITIKEFVKEVERDDVKMQFALLGMHFTDGHTFFKLLDVDENGSLAIDEFVMGCVRLKGGALLIDSNVKIQETKALVTHTARANRKALMAIASGVRELQHKLCPVGERH